MPYENVIFNKANIEGWKSERPILKKKVLKLSKKIEKAEASIHLIQASLTQVQLKISSIETQLSIADLRTTQDIQYHESHHGHSSNNTSILHTIDDLLSAGKTISLTNELNNLKNKRFKLEKDIDDYQNQIVQCQQSIRETKERITWIKRNVAQGEEFLQNIKNAPSLLVDNLSNKILSRLKNYDKKHPLGLPEEVRGCLLYIQEKLTLLTSTNTTVLPALNPEVIAPEIYCAQINYLRLCGFLWEMYRLVESKVQDKSFLLLLDELIESTHIPEAGDLPDEFQTGQTSNNYFSQTKRSTWLFSFDLSKTEKKIFEYELSSLQAYFQRQNLLQISFENTTSLIQSEITERLANNEEIDYRFYTRILHNLNILKSDHLNSEAREDLIFLAQYASGAPSISKQVLGGIAVTIGVLLIVASIGCLVATCFSGSPICALGIGIGMTLLQTQITFGIVSSLSAIFSSGLSFFGINKIKDGKRKGLSKELVDIPINETPLSAVPAT
ncbi:hypothetical protein [Legionella gresilensis]|uniref:hypothetical protein n=1 Tax=Legionella gresilensis TaxID=91823 RepID=UPI0010415A48|nr:hypothetical protein [Legionella gresilensis]